MIADALPPVDSQSAKPWYVNALPWAALALGLGLAFGPVWTSEPRQVPWDPFDGRLVHFSLEHAHRFVVGQAPHQDFWDPPIFYPARNVAAYTDTLLGFVPFYTPWRLIGASPNTALQLWMLSVLTLTFWTGYWSLRSLFSLSIPAASVGAYVFSFAGPRLVMFVHLQLLPWFYWALALLALGRLFLTNPCAQATSGRRRFWIGLFSVSLVAQAYGAFYPFFFFVFLFLLGLLLALTSHTGRRELARLWTQEGPALAFAAAMGGLLLAPLAQRYLLTARLVGSRDFSEILDLSPRLFSWWIPNIRSRLFGSLWDLSWIESAPNLFGSPHHALGLGLLMPILAAIGLWGQRSRGTVRLLAGLWLLIVVLTLRWPNGFSLWKWIYAAFPGASAIRSTDRFALCLLVPVALGVAFFFHSLAIRKRPALGVALFALLAAEQNLLVVSHDPAADRQQVRAMVEALDPNCGSFHAMFFGDSPPSPAFTENAMWAMLESGIPTINGRYGNSPPQWHLFWRDRPCDSKTRQVDLDRGMQSWLNRYSIDAADVCRLWVDHSGLKVVPLPRPTRSKETVTCIN